MRTKDRQIGELIDKLTSLSTNKNKNNDDGNANKHKRGPKRGRDTDDGDGSGDGSKDDKKAIVPSYNLLFDKADGGKPRINWGKIRKKRKLGLMACGSVGAIKDVRRRARRAANPTCRVEEIPRCSKKCEKREEGTNLSRKES